LTALWARLAGASPATLEEDFFATDGDSLAALCLVYEVNERFGVEITIDAFMDDPTLAGLLHLISKTSGDTETEPSATVGRPS
jgi:acyl carrier protein